MTQHYLPPRIHVLAKPTGVICNLACSYCFFLDKELLYPGSRFRMSDEVLENYIRQLIAAHRSPQVTVAWQGGEPTLMGIDFYRRAVELQEKYRKPGMTFENTMQTNGTLLDDEWCRFFKENGFLIGISIDGPRELHNSCRVDKKGDGTFDRVMRGLRLLQKHGVEYNVLTTVNSVNADYPLEVYRFLRDEQGKRPVYGGTEKFQSDPYWRDYILFYEYFHGDNGAGVGASHQTGWTGLVAKLIQLFGLLDAESQLETGMMGAFKK